MMPGNPLGSNSPNGQWNHGDTECTENCIKDSRLRAEDRGTEPRKTVDSD